MTNSNTQYTFFKFPVALMTEPQYSQLSVDAKIAYMLFIDRNNYSIKNNLCDKNQQTYFIFPNSELTAALGYSEKKIIAIKKELEQVNLLKQVRGGFNKPTRLYLGELVTDQVYSIDQSTVNSDKIDNQEVSDINVTDQLTVDNTAYLDKTINPDTIKDTIKDTANVLSQAHSNNNSKQKEQTLERELLADLPQTLNNQDNATLLNDKAVRLISLWSNTVQEATDMIGTILNAKNKIQKEFETYIFIDDNSQEQHELTRTLQRVITKARSGANLKSFKNYMFIAFKNVFQDMAMRECINI